MIQEAIRTEPQPVRRRLPDERRSVTRKFVVGGVRGYLNVGLYPDGQPGEMFIRVEKEHGSTLCGLIDQFAIMASVALQYGCPLEVICRKFEFTRFEPSGPTNDRDIPMATSIVDYVARWMRKRFLPGEVG
jgi:ribonucleoside-diphosphate reductase alpha chain